MAKKWVQIEPYCRAISTNKIMIQGENELIIDHNNVHYAEKIIEFLEWNKVFINDVEKKIQRISQIF